MKQPFAPHLLALTEGANIPLDKPIVLIGRHQECDIQIPSRKISRRHCCIAQVADHLVVRDLGSTNGIRINGIKVVEGNLQPNDELTIGNVRYQLKWGADSEHTLAAAAQAKHAITAGKPNLAKKTSAEDSRDEPVVLPDMSLSHPALQGKPAPTNLNDPNKANGEALGVPLVFPDEINLIPLEPPNG